jgi:hypothetical protein
MRIETVLLRHEARLLRLPYVTGAGIGNKDGKEVIIVFVRQKVPESSLHPSDVIPKNLDGYQTDVRQEIRVGKKRRENMKEKKAENVGVINPWALAEVILGKKISWRKIADPRKLLSETLGMPYEKLFDPVNRSPLYAGLELDAKTKTMKRVENARTAGKAYRASPNVKAVIWEDPGDFFEEGTELTDPVQGALGDCYLIAALSSVAWGRPYVIAQRNRATGPSQQQFVNMIEFYASGKPEKIEVSELIPLQSPGNNYIYARSSEKGEIWPAVYEKAYAKWRTKNTGDKPDYGPIAGGDPVGAMAQLTGLTPYYKWNSGFSAHDIWQLIRANSISMKTFNPMTAWTHATSPSPDVNYNTSGIVANHAYSILGWAYSNNTEYIVLRNPWGWNEPTTNVLGGFWTAWDQPYYGSSGWWRPVDLNVKNDGIFALPSAVFKKYYAGFGWVKTPESP